MEAKHLGMVGDSFTYSTYINNLIPICKVKAGNKPESRCVSEALSNLQCFRENMYAAVFIFFLAPEKW